jgi:hypothetical protein
MALVVSNISSCLFYLNTKYREINNETRNFYSVNDYAFQFCIIYLMYNNTTKNETIDQKEEYIENTIKIIPTFFTRYIINME